jgi:hypothetical protein
MNSHGCAATEREQTSSRLPNAAKGIELSGGHQYGGYHYSVAVVDQNTTTAVDQPANTSPYVPSATGGANGGVGFGSDSSFKNYLRPASPTASTWSATRKAGTPFRPPGPTGPRTTIRSSNLGSFYIYTAKSLQQFAGATLQGNNTTLQVQEPYYRAGGDFNFNFRRLNVYGLYMYGRDHNLLPIDASGALIMLPLTAAAPLPIGFVQSVPATFHGGFAQADYIIFPWLMAIGRWDGVHSSADRINGLALSTGTPYFGPLDSTRNRYTPGLQFLIHPNLKFSFEYQFRPQQSVVIQTNPTTGALTAINPFRVNTALFGLEFVY